MKRKYGHRSRYVLSANRSVYSSMIISSSSTSSMSPSADDNSSSLRMRLVIHSVYMGTLTYTPGRLGVAHSTPQLTMPPTNHRSRDPSIGHSSGPPESPCGGYIENVNNVHIYIINIMILCQSRQKRTFW